MRRQYSIPQIVLFLFVVNLGIVIGGGLYETLVILPLWSMDPPNSVLAYYHHYVANPQFAIDQGGRFWIFFTPMLGGSSIATILTGLKTDPEHRRWRIAGAVLSLAVVVFTFAWFIPTLITLTGEEVTTLSGQRIASLTNWWVRFNWVRVAFYLAGWLAGLVAMTKPAGAAAE